MHRNKKYTLEEVKSYIESISGYKLLSSFYKNCDTPLDVLHEECNTIFHPTFYNFRKYATRCPHCYGVPKITFDYVKSVIETDGKYQLISTEYLGAFGSLNIKCKTCNNIFASTWARFSEGNRCPFCANNKRRNSYESVKNFIEKDNLYSLLSTDYINARSKLKIKCNKCSRIFYMSWNKFSQGRRCTCNLIGGNKFIYEYLIKNNYKENINFIREYRDENCCSKKELPFDFRINIKDRYFLVEIQGKQHYSQIGSKFCTKELLEHDEIKKNFCKSHNIHLYLIPFIDGNTEKLIDNFSDILRKEGDILNEN